MTNGHALWYRLLMHCTNQGIRDLILCTEGMEKLVGYRYNEHENCPGCMIGKELGGVHVFAKMFPEELQESQES